MTPLLEALGKLIGADDLTDDNAVEKITAFGTSHTEQVAEVKTLKDQLADLETKAGKGAMPKVDEDLLEDLAEAREGELAQLVTAGKITPAVQKGIAAALIGESGKRRVLGLSTKAAKHLGLTGPLAKQIIDALKENDPALLMKMQEKTGPQRLALTRSDSDESDDKWVDEQIKQQNERVKKTA